MYFFKSKQDLSEKTLLLPPDLLNNNKSAINWSNGNKKSYGSFLKCKNFFKYLWNKNKVC